MTERDELVAPGRFGAPLDLDNWRSRVWDKAVEKAGVDATHYDLRHTFVSLRFHEGRYPIWVADQVGHTPSSLTQNQYGHLIPRPASDAPQVDDRGDSCGAKYFECTTERNVRTLRTTAKRRKRG